MASSSQTRLLFSILLIASLLGCKGEGPTEPEEPGPRLKTRLVGDYTLRTEEFGGITYWVRFTSKNKYIGLIERDNGVRLIERYDWAIVDTVTAYLTFGGGWHAIFSENDSVLTLVSDHENDTFVYRRASGMPDPASWVRDIEVADELFPPSNDPTDFSWDGRGLWYPRRLLAKALRRMVPELDLAVDSTLAVDHAGLAVAYDAGDFWVDDALDNRIYMIDGGTGETIAGPILEAGGQIKGLVVAPDGDLWISRGSRLTRLDLGSGAEVDSVELYNSTDGLEMVSGTLYVAMGSAGIARLQGPPWRVSQMWKLDKRNIRGIAFGNGDWWLYLIDNRAAVQTQIVKAKLL